MRIKAIKYKWINFNCDYCGEPIQVLLGTWSEVTCSCGRLHDIKNFQEKENVKEKKKVMS